MALKWRASQTIPELRIADVGDGVVQWYELWRTGPNRWTALFCDEGRSALTKLKLDVLAQGVGFAHARAAAIAHYRALL